MNSRSDRTSSLITALVTLLAAPAIALAQTYPVKPVRMVLPLPPGGAIDIVGRTVGGVVAEKFGQSMIFDNRPGANTIVATENCINSSKDGYNLCFITSNLSLNQALYSKLPYDHIRDLEPITNMVLPYEALFLTGSIPANNIKELVAYSKANPGKLNFGSLGIGGSPHVVPEWVARNTGASLTHIPFKGLPDLMRAFTAGEIHMFFLALGNPGYVENIKAGKMKVMFFGGDKRNPVFGEVPTMPESGVPDHGFRSWWGMAAPKGTPKEVIDRLHGLFVEALRTPSVRDRFTTMSLEIAGNTPGEFAKFLLEDRDRAARLVKTSGAKLD